MKPRKTVTANAATAATAATAAAQANTPAGPAAAEGSELARALAGAIDHLRDERLDEAEPALLAILARWPEQPDALHYFGVLRHTQGQVDEAVALIRRALALVPANSSAWNNLGNVLLLAGRGEDAATAYERAVALGDDMPGDGVRALNNLGVLHRKLGRLVDSELSLRRALERAPDFADGWYNLATTLIKLGRINEGVLAHSKAVALWPEELQSGQEVIRALLLLGERARAGKLLREWLARDPDDAVAQHMLAACEAADGQAVPERASDGYVRQVFDGFAGSFDAKLEALHYRAPALVVQALESAAGAPAGRLSIIDAGCGTGLCGPGLRPHARHLAGCDLSGGMLKRAQSRKVYDLLHQAELTHYLATQDDRVDAVVSADTLCYFGPLEAVLAAARRCLRPGGWLIFTVEALPDDAAMPHRLQANGRYAHGRAYLRAALEAAGFELRAIGHEQLRMETGQPVMGWLVSARSR